MQGRSLVRLRVSTIVGLTLLVACGGDKLSGLKPKLAFHDGTPKDSMGLYHLDFGDVQLGQQGTRTLTIDSLGLVTLHIEAPVVATPFGVQPAAAQQVVAHGNQQFAFSFLPTAEGPSQTTVNFVSDGGNASVILSGNGTKTAPPDQSCTFELRPATIDFGNVQPGKAQTSGVRVVNTSSVMSAECEVMQLALSADSDPAFTLPNPPSVPQPVPAGTNLPIGVVFSPSHYGYSFRGKLELKIGAPGMGGMVVEVPLSGTAIGNCPAPLPDGSCPVANPPPINGHPPAATAPIYLNDSGSLYTFDPATKTTRYIAAFSTSGFPIFTMYDIAIDSTGWMVGVASGELYNIDPTNGHCTSLASVPDSGANGLTFTPDGRIVVAGAEIVIYNPTTKQLSTLVPSGTQSTSGDIVGLPDGLLYWAVTGSSSDVLFTVNPNTGTLRRIGDIGTSKVWGLSYEKGVLFGFTSDGKYLTIDQQTGQGQAQPLSGNWYGAATNPAKWM
jgi:WD40 repeat protein